MVYSPNRSLDLFLILGCMISNFLYLSFSSFYSSSLWRTDTFVFAKLNKPPSQVSIPSLLTPPPPSSNVLELNKPPGGNSGLTVCIWRCSWIGNSCPSTPVLYTIINLQYVYESTRHIWGIQKKWKFLLIFIRCWLHDGEWLYKAPILTILLVSRVSSFQQYILWYTTLRLILQITYGSMHACIDL